MVVNIGSDMATAYLGLGSNLGDRLSALRAAVRALDEHPRIRVDFDSGVASLYETSPVGGPSGQGLYLNSAVRVQTTLTPEELLTAVLSIEASLGRFRGEPDGPRIVDIDLLLYEGTVLSDERLSLPHPRMHQRRFVLEPLAEIAADILHPVLRHSVAELARLCREERSTADQVTRIDGPGWYREAPPGPALHTPPVRQADRPTV
jgi:2-amino-4-hydroxy-6-hydroxymethyldihydropteridine diphosphokinase